MSAPPLWTAQDAAAATGGTATGGWTAGGVSIDTREMAPGDLFVALAGESRDGHAFVAQALAGGAGAAMVSEAIPGLAADAPLLRVADTLAGLSALGAAGRNRAGARVAAVTGSVGKTTTKDMLAAMLGAQGSVHAAARSFNNHWGVPLTLARMPAAADWAVLEIGMNHRGEIAPLARLARPHAALITTVAPVHLEFFDSLDDIAEEKADILAGLEPGGTAVLNADIPHYPRLCERAREAGARILSFGSAGQVRLVSARIVDAVTVAQVEIAGSRMFLRIAAPGLHFAANACAALAAAVALEADPALAVLGLGQWRPAEGRGTRERLLLGPAGIEGSITLIDESFNANPASMRAALAVLGAAPVTDDVGRVARGRRIAFLGDMLELGPTEGALHAALADLPELGRIDLVHCCGARMRALHEALPRERRGQWFADSAALAQRVRKLLDAGDVCMVKGSKGARMGPVVEAIRRLGTPDDGTQEA